jgi:hypothetical protein
MGNPQWVDRIVLYQSNRGNKVFLKKGKEEREKQQES